MKSEYHWLDKVKELLENSTRKTTSRGKPTLLWCRHKHHDPTSIFDENAHKMAMIQHSMKIGKEAVAYINPSQTPVITMGQPLFDTASSGRKQVCSERKNVLWWWVASMSKWLTWKWWGTGWKEVGGTLHWHTMILRRANGTLKAAHINRSHYAHQVSACALYMLQRKAYKEYRESSNSGKIDFTTWVQTRKEDHLHSYSWQKY